MASPTQAPPNDPRNQTFFLQGPHNASIPVWVPAVDKVLQQALGTAINYGSQIGACFLMLLVTLTMTSKSRFSRASTIINIAGLAIGTVRCTLLALYFTSSYLEFYMFFTGDFSRVNANDTRISAAATFFALPQLVLIEAALFLQAYSMIKLWPSAWRAAILVLSAVIAAFAIGFKFASVALRMRSTLDFYVNFSVLWVYEVDLAFTATTIFWFCFIFIIRLVLHMWEYRSILPPMGGVSAMEVLVMANGILMLVPVIFAAMELGNFTKFEAGSLTYTSVIVLLPLGTLIAQSMTRPNGYVSRSNVGGAGGRLNSSGSGGSGGSGNARSGGGAYSRATTNTADSKKKSAFGTWSHASDATTALVSGTVSTQVKIQSGKGGSGGDGGGNLGIERDNLPVDHIEKELQLIDATPMTTADGDGTAAGRVWVDHEVEVRRDMV